MFPTNAQGNNVYSNEGIEVSIENISDYSDEATRDMLLAVEVKIKNKNMYAAVDIDLEANDNNTFDLMSGRNKRVSLQANEETSVVFTYFYKGYHKFKDPDHFFYLDKQKREVHIKAKDTEEKVYDYEWYLNKLIEASKGEVATSSIIKQLDNSVEKKELNEKRSNNNKFPFWIIIVALVIVFIIAVILILKLYKYHKDTYYCFINLFLVLSMLILMCINKVNAMGIETFMYEKRYVHEYVGKVYHANLPHNMSYTISYKYNGENPYENDNTDSDGDGLLNAEEVFYMSDVNNVDTDSDGLSDYMEVYKLNLSPINIDTDNNGINDADEDYDLDGLTNIEEIRGIVVEGTVFNSDPSESDTDYDGLNDYDEVKGNNVYSFISNPSIVDTDNDGLSDFEELTLNKKFNLSLQNEDKNLIALNPRNEKSNDIDLDKNRKFKQELSNSNIESSLYKDNVIIPKVSGFVSGYIDEHIKVREDKDFERHNYILGKVLNIENDYVGEKVIVSFDVSKYSDKVEYLKVATVKSGKVSIIEPVIDGNVISCEVAGGKIFVIDSAKYIDSIISFRKDNWK